MFDFVDIFLEYCVALLMNLCLRTNGRKQCAEIAEQAITVLSALLTHPNHEVSYFLQLIANYNETSFINIFLLFFTRSDATVC
jgi:hypothetical protein